MACCSATVPATPTVSPPKGFKLPCSFCSSTNGFAAHSPTAASTTAPTPSTSRPANSKPPTTAPTRPFNRSSICSPPELTVTIVELFLSTILQDRIYHMGLREPIRRSTLADANESRDWRIYADLAQRLIAQARKLYATKDLGLDLTNTVYALDSTTIDLCLSVFPWAHFRTTKAAVKMHTLLDLRGNIPSFIHVSDGKLADVHALDLLLPEAGAIYVMDRGYVDFARLHALHQAGAFFVTRTKSNMNAHRVYSAPTDRTTGII